MKTFLTLMLGATILMGVQPAKADVISLIREGIRILSEPVIAPLTEYEKLFVNNMKTNYELLKDFEAEPGVESTDYYPMVVVLLEIKKLSKEVVDLSAVLSNSQNSGYGQAVATLRERYARAEVLWERLEELNSGKLLARIKGFFQNFGIKTAWAGDGFTGDPLIVAGALDSIDNMICSDRGGSMMNASNPGAEYCCSNNIVQRVNGQTGQIGQIGQIGEIGQQCCFKGECCPAGEKKASDGKCCEQQRYGWDANGSSFCCSENEVTWPQDFTNGNGAWTCCNPEKVGTSNGKCCTKDRWVWGTDRKVSCCKEGEEAVFTGEKTFNGMKVSICCKPGETGTPKGCCPPGRGYTTTYGKHECCEEGKEAKMMKNGSAICCKPTDNVIDGKCCPEERSGWDSKNNKPICCGEGEAVVADGSCCEKDRIFNSPEEGGDICCPDSRYGKDEDGNSQCCYPDEKIMSVMVGEEEIENTGILRPKTVDICCSTDTELVTDDGQCCTHERTSYRASEKGRRMSSVGVKVESYCCGPGETGAKFASGEPDGCCPKDTFLKFKQLDDGKWNMGCCQNEDDVVVDGGLCCPRERVATIYKKDEEFGGYTSIGEQCCTDDNYPYGVNNDDKTACCPNPDDVPVSDEYPCCPKNRLYVDSMTKNTDGSVNLELGCCPEGHHWIPWDGDKN